RLPKTVGCNLRVMSHDLIDIGVVGYPFQLRHRSLGIEALECWGDRGASIDGGKLGTCPLPHFLTLIWVFGQGLEMGDAFQPLRSIRPGDQAGGLFTRITLHPIRSR